MDVQWVINMTCNEDCKEYPQYGVGPHICYHKKPGGFSNPLGTSELIPESEWPSNYVEDPDAPGLGVYFCPLCKKGMEEYINEVQMDDRHRKSRYRL